MIELGVGAWILLCIGCAYLMIKDRTDPLGFA